MKMVNWVIEGLIDNKIQDARRLKRKTAELFIQTIAIIVVSTVKFLGSSNSLNCLIRMYRDYMRLN
jgi:hypothetical protein